jgi:hypothetical protein
MIDVLDKERQGLDPRLKEIIDQEAKDREARDPGGFVVCAACSHVVARRSDQTEVNGSFDHWFTNPYGLEFHVGCFSDALGCAIAGQRVAADTWFSGFYWRLASCEACHQHLGWYFDQPDGYFYGLVLEYIKEGS